MLFIWSAKRTAEARLFLSGRCDWPDLSAPDSSDWFMTLAATLAYS